MVISTCFFFSSSGDGYVAVSELLWRHYFAWRAFSPVFYVTVQRHHEREQGVGVGWKNRHANEMQSLGESGVHSILLQGVLSIVNHALSSSWIMQMTKIILCKSKWGGGVGGMGGGIGVGRGCNLNVFDSYRRKTTIFVVCFVKRQRVGGGGGVGGWVLWKQYLTPCSLSFWLRPRKDPVPKLSTPVCPGCEFSKYRPSASLTLCRRCRHVKPRFEGLLHWSHNYRPLPHYQI